MTADIAVMPVANVDLVPVEFMQYVIAPNCSSVERKFRNLLHMIKHTWQIIYRYYRYPIFINKLFLHTTVEVRGLYCTPVRQFTSVLRIRNK